MATKVTVSSARQEEGLPSKEEVGNEQAVNPVRIPRGGGCGRIPLTLLRTKMFASLESKPSERLTQTAA